MGAGVIRRCYCPCDLSERTLSILGLLGSSLEPGISSLGRSICFYIVGCSTSKLSTRSSIMSLYLLRIDKISDFSCPPQLLAWGYISWELPQYDLDVEKVFQPRSFPVKYTPLNQSMFGCRNKENYTKYWPFSLFWAYGSNRIALFPNGRFLLFMHNLRSSIATANIAHMTLIISLQKREKKRDMCGFRPRL